MLQPTRSILEDLVYSATSPCLVPPPDLSHDAIRCGILKLRGVFGGQALGGRECHRIAYAWDASGEDKENEKDTPKRKKRGSQSN